MKKEKKLKITVTVTNKPSREAMEDFTSQVLNIYNEIITNDDEREEAA